MKAVMWENTGSRHGVICKQPSQARIERLLKKKRLKKQGKHDNATKRTV